MPPERVVRAAPAGLGRKRDVIPGGLNKTIALLNGPLLSAGAGSGVNRRVAEMRMSSEVLAGT